MNDSRYEKLRPLVAHLSERLTTADGDATLQQILKLGQILAAGAPPSAAPAPPMRGGDLVGIWRPRGGGAAGEFERDRARFHQWRAFADVDRIPAKSARKRILLLGESVARGMFYDPVYTPAIALAAALARGGGDYEVVDLAMSGMGPTRLLRILSQVRALQPDMILFFGGNNWNLDYAASDVEPMHFGEVSLAFSQGLDRYKRAIDQTYVRSLAVRMVGRMADVARELKAPFAIVVPEHNLADWHDDFPVPLAEPNAVAEWYWLKVEAQTACLEGRWEDVERLAGRMQQIDRGLASLPHLLRARRAMARGATDVARTHFEAERDCAGALPRGLPPRCLSVTQEVLRSASARHGMAVIDLPRLFTRDGGIPGRAQFLDYCHLTVRGTEAAVCALAEAVLERCPAGGSHPGPAPGPSQASLPVQAMAHFLAGIHNSILLQSCDVVRHHCREALRLDPGLADVMQLYFRNRFSSLPDWLDPEIGAVCSLPNAARILNQEAPPPSGKFFPHEMLRAAAELLPQAWLVSCRAGMCRRFSRSETRRRINLLDPRFRRVTLLAPPAGYYVSTERQVEFVFPRPDAARLRISVCCRTPQADNSEPMRVSLDRASLWTGAVGSSWMNLELDCENAVSTAATLKIVWPLPRENFAGWKEARQAVAGGRRPDIYPSFGEIHSLFLSW